ncbi:MAG: hypothetical protein K9M81_03995 [Chthoniobacterales bacterium]|nr:hypothetical protein [Chthoniobacterales bacterium]
MFQLTRIFHTDRDEEAAKAHRVRQTSISIPGYMSPYYPRKTSSSTQHPCEFPVFTANGNKISGSALLMVLVFLAFWSVILFTLLERAQFEKKRAVMDAAQYQATLAAESGLSAAMGELALATSNNPTFLVGLTNSMAAPEIAPALMIGAHSLTNTQELIPLISGDLEALQSYPNLPEGMLDSYLQARESKDPEKTIDLNANHHPISANGSYPAPWVMMRNQQGQPIARYAFIILDEQARLHPLLHQGKPRADPIDWDHGVAVLPYSLLLTEQEHEKASELLSNPLSLEGFKEIFENRNLYDLKKEFLSSTSVPLPDLIPARLPDGGHPKYNLNDLATNVIYGATPSDRSAYLASIIDHNLPHFKERDPSLRNLSAGEQRRYLNRLAASIVNYITPEHTSVLVNGGEPAGAALTPLVTQTAERCRLVERMSNSVIIENQYFVQLWNPYTKMIPAGGKATFEIENRQQLHFGTAPNVPFKDYLQTNSCVPALRPNESIVVEFPTVTQRWDAPNVVPLSEHPYWLEGPEGNTNPKEHQAFRFFWNDHLVMMSRRPPCGPGPAEGGLEHDAQSLTDGQNFWQCNFIPTEGDRAGHFRFVGDPRENYLSNYLWKSYSSEKSYLTQTRWKGAMSDASAERLFDPSISWRNRDFVPVNPLAGNRPSSRSVTPAQVPSSYLESRDAMMAPLVLRHGPMQSIAELGHINDPAQADDLGAAPNVGAADNKSSIYGSGGGRTLRIGQPEFSYWDRPGERAIELIDLFTVTSTNNTTVQIKKNMSLTQSGFPASVGYQYEISGLTRIFHTDRDEEDAKADGVRQTSILTQGCMSTYCPSQNMSLTQHPSGFPAYAVDQYEICGLTLWREGLININTASHQVLSSLFYGISPTSDARFTHSAISKTTAEELATFLEEHRPYEKLSDLHILTPLLANATTYTPPLSTNILSEGRLLAAVFDRAREEAFGKMISLCTVQSRAFRAYVIGESLSATGKKVHGAFLEALIILRPEHIQSEETPGSSLFIPVIQKKEWLR